MKLRETDSMYKECVREKWTVQNNKTIDTIMSTVRNITNKNEVFWLLLGPLYDFTAAIPNRCRSHENFLAVCRSPKQSTTKFPAFTNVTVFMENRKGAGRAAAPASYPTQCLLLHCFQPVQNSLWSWVSSVGAVLVSETVWWRSVRTSGLYFLLLCFRTS